MEATFKLLCRLSLAALAFSMLRGIVLVGTMQAKTYRFELDRVRAVTRVIRETENQTLASALLAGCFALLTLVCRL